MSGRGYTVNLERAVLATLLLEPAKIADAAQLLDAEDFSEVRHGLVYETLLDLWRAGTPNVDQYAVKLELERIGRLDELDGEDAAGWLLELGRDPAADVRLLDRRCREVALLALARAAQDAGRDFVRDTADPKASLNDSIAKLRSRLSEIEAQDADGEVLEPIGEALDAVFAQIDSGHIDPGTPTLLPPLDWVIGGGIKPTQLVTVAAATSMGKTSLATQIGINVAGWAKQHDKGAVLIFSYEMNADELGVRMICQMADLRESYRAPKGWRDRDDLEEARRAHTLLRELPLYVITRCDDNVPAIESVVRRYIERHGKPALVIVDHIGLLTVPDHRGNRTEAVGRITRGLKNMARLLQIPVVALAQLSRDVEKREDHRPQLSDLRESGSIEQDSNTVIFIYRPSYYDKNLTDEMRQALEEAGAPAKLMVEKNRSGPKAALEMTWIGPRYLFQVPDEWFAKHGLPQEDGLIARPVRGAGAPTALAAGDSDEAPPLPTPEAESTEPDDYEDAVEKPGANLDEVDLLFGSG